MGLFDFNPAIGETPQSVANKRAIAQALLMSRAPAHDVGEGLGQLGNAIAFRLMQNKVDAGQAEGQKQAQTGFAPIIAALNGQGQQTAPMAPVAAPQAPMPTGPQNTDVNPAAMSAQPPAPTNLRDGIITTAKSLGIDPVDLGTAMSYETAGTFDPTKAGPTTQWGQHRGLIQFGEPQAQKYGVDWKNPIGSQLGPDGAVAKYLKDAGVKPGMGLMDIYSAINAGGVGRNDATDANNGGAPGTVADKVNNQMAEHRANAMRLLGGDAQGQPAPQISPAGGQPHLDAAMLVQAMNDPWIAQDPAKMGIIQMLLKQQMDQQNPLTQLQMQQAQQGLAEGKIKMDQMQHPDLVPQTPLQKAQADYYSGRNDKATTPSAVQEYQFAKNNGYPGSFADWTVMSKSGVNIYNNGGGSQTQLPQVQVDQNGVPDKASQEAFISKLPQNDATLVKGMLNYQIDPTKFASMKGGERQRLVELAQAADPTFDISQFKSRQAFKQSLGSGNYGNALNSANLVIQHMDALAKAANSLGNGQYPALNYLNTGAQALGGKESITNFRTAKKAVAAELAKVFKGVGATDVNSINEWESNFSENSSPEQIKGAINTATALLSSRIDTIRNQYQSVMGKPTDFKFLTPHSQEVLQKLGLDLGDAGVPPVGNDQAAPSQGQPSLPSNLPTEAVNELKADPSPESQAQFDAIFGAGASKRALGQYHG